MRELRRIELHRVPMATGMENRRAAIGSDPATEMNGPERPSRVARRALLFVSNQPPSVLLMSRQLELANDVGFCCSGFHVWSRERREEKRKHLTRERVTLPRSSTQIKLAAMSTNEPANTMESNQIES